MKLVIEIEDGKLPDGELRRQLAEVQQNISNENEFITLDGYFQVTRIIGVAKRNNIGPPDDLPTAFVAPLEGSGPVDLW